MAELAFNLPKMIGGDMAVVSKSQTLLGEGIYALRGIHGLNKLLEKNLMV